MTTLEEQQRYGIPAGTTTTSVNGRDFYRVDRPPYLTRAVLVAAGYELYEWMTVSVKREHNQNPPCHFTFTTSEQEPLGEWSALRLKPPDPCQIFLNGYLIVNGWIDTRQVFYDGRQHQVQLQGVSWAGRAGRAPAVSPTGEMKNKDIQELSQQLLSAIGLNLKTKGMLDKTKIPRVSIQPGETTWDTIERHARPTGTKLVDDPQGNFVLVGTAPHTGTPYVVEGLNILWGREIIKSTAQNAEQFVMAQGPGSDNESGADVAQRHGKDSSGNSMLTQGGTLGRSLMEIPAFADSMMKMRAQHESAISDTNQINVQVSVLGWEKPGGGLWVEGESVYIYSPMLIMDRPLFVWAVTYTQDGSGGTRTELHLVNDTAMRGMTPSIE
jgi:prophage tail gpP-like protein